MLTWSTVFLIISIILGLYGFAGDSKFTSQAAKCFCGIFTILFIISLIYSFLPEPRKEYAGQQTGLYERQDQITNKSFIE
ncbi:MAG: DUF1328 domain-containing protein [Chlamydiia bacterium]|nr:DUF1328 domain-containing protein [Chlamydiia bacterium]